MSSTIGRAKHLRKNMTRAETLLWSVLREIPESKFRRQVPLGPYIVDFTCYSNNLIIEVDGGQHAESKADQQRDQWLHEQGFRVLRFWNHDVLTNLTGVGEAVYQALAKAKES